MTPIPDRPAAPSPEVVEVAAKLTKAQREALIEGRWAIWPLSQAFIDAGVATREPICNLRLTPLGLAVRAHLLANQGDGRHA